MWHMLFSAGVAAIDTVPSVCSPMWCRECGSTDAVPVWSKDGFCYQLAAGRGDWRERLGEKMRVAYAQVELKKHPSCTLKDGSFLDGDEAAGLFTAKCCLLTCEDFLRFISRLRSRTLNLKRKQPSCLSKRCPWRYRCKDRYLFSSE